MTKANKDRRFKTSWYHYRARHWLRADRRQAQHHRPQLECFRLDVLSENGANEKPPVRIYLGTEAAHYRAERVFIWSICQVRDPARSYEIYLMKDLVGFNRDGWKTGFTKYRYAVPELAGATGRAIYNDVDQFYLTDPAELFDTEMDGAAVMSVTERDNSVMLMDCQRLAELWPKADVYSTLPHQQLRERAASASLWRAFDGRWNARDGEFELSQAHCRHYTTLHRQPWQPFPEQLTYQPNADADAWMALEKAADEANFEVFSRAKPSRHYQQLGDQYRQVHENDQAISAVEPARPFDGRRLPKSVDAVAQLINRTASQTVLDYGCGQASHYAAYADEPADSRFKAQAEWPGVKVICYDPGYAPFSTPWEEPVDGVISTDVIEHVPDFDVPWVLDGLFSQAERFVYVLAACYPARMILPNGENAHCTVQRPRWWYDMMQWIGARHPDICWTLACETKGVLGKKRRYFYSDSLSAER